MRSNIGRGLVFHVNELERLGGVRRGLARRLPSLLASGASPARPRGDSAKDVAITPINEARKNHRGAGRFGPRVALLRAARVGTEPPGTSSRYSTLIKRPAKGGPPHRRATGGGPVVSRDRGTLTGLGEEAAPASVVPRHAQRATRSAVERCFHPRPRERIAAHLADVPARHRAEQHVEVERRRIDRATRHRARQSALLAT